jgi:leucyl/phenylalanyl-tRNA--protein transferase
MSQWIVSVTRLALYGFDAVGKQSYLEGVSEVLDPGLLLQAYAAGIFPMADSRHDAEVYWVDPRRRGILPLDGFRLSRSLAKTLRSERYQTTANRAFGDVVAHCAEAAPGRPSTWINGKIESSVNLLHRAGHAHSIETWREGELVGGLYGISLGRAFFGESMFSRATDASKVALAHLVARLRAGGFVLLDCQFITPHLASLGAIEIGRRDYMALLSAALPTTGGSAEGAGDFGALDRRAAAADPSFARTTSVSAPISGCFIAQALVQTS